MTKFLMIYERLEPTNLESAKGWQRSADKGLLEFRKCLSYEVTVEDFQWCDAIVAVRATSAMEWRLAKYAKELGKYWITFLDDDFLSLPSRVIHDSRKKALLKLLKYTDCLSACNKKLAEKYSKLGDVGKYVLGYTTFPDDEKFAEPRIHEGKTKIVYYVNDGTQEIFNTYIKPVFALLAERYENKLAVYFLATHPDMSEYEDKMEIHYVPHMSFDQFLQYMQESGFAIGLAPLDDNGFNKYKYFNKYVEYTRAGIVGVYSDCELYRQVVSSGYNGILCENAVDCWADAISFLVDNPQKRVEIAKNAQVYARNTFSEEASDERFYEVFPELVNFSAPAKKVSPIRLASIKKLYRLFRLRGNLETLFLCLKEGDISTIVDKVRDTLGRRK